MTDPTIQSIGYYINSGKHSRQKTVSNRHYRLCFLQALWFHSPVNENEIWQGLTHDRAESNNSDFIANCSPGNYGPTLGNDTVV